MSALYGEMERLCQLCDAPLPVGTYCLKCEEHVPTYEYPVGARPAYAVRQSRIERLIAESRECDTRCLAAVDELAGIREGGLG